MLYNRDKRIDGEYAPPLPERNSKAYGFTAEDIEDTERNLAIWEKRYKDMKGVDFDESGINREI